MSIYLDCPFVERDLAKGLGAQFDRSTKRMFVPSSHYKDIWMFNRWRPANGIYLDCPFEDKDKAKKADAKWDPVVKSWYVHDVKPGMIPSAALSSNSSPFVLSWNVHDVNSGMIPSAALSSYNASPPASKKRGNAQDAATRRINDRMTVEQLQEEWRARGMSGYSGKTKDYLLKQLGTGSIWQAMSMKDKKEKEEGATTKKKKAGDKPTPARQHTATKTKATPTAKAKPSPTFCIYF